MKPAQKFGAKIFMPFVVLGDPDYETSAKIIKGLIDNGAGALELGFAFTDPIADGPAIQKADYRALKEGITTKKAFEIIKQVREYSSIPISLMLSYNLIYKYGEEKFYFECKNTGVNAILCPDVALEEITPLLKLSKKYKIAQVFIVSPTTTPHRMKKISKLASGYLYAVSLLGTTGTRKSVGEELAPLIKNAKKYFKIPIYAGFGISKPEHVKEVLAIGADGAISGSAVCNVIEKNAGNKEEIILQTSSFCKEMSSSAHFRKASPTGLKKGSA